MLSPPPRQPVPASALFLECGFKQIFVTIPTHRIRAYWMIRAYVIPRGITAAPRGYDSSYLHPSDRASGFRVLYPKPLCWYVSLRFPAVVSSSLCCCSGCAVTPQSGDGSMSNRRTPPGPVLLIPCLAGHYRLKIMNPFYWSLLCQTLQRQPLASVTSEEKRLRTFGFSLALSGRVPVPHPAGEAMRFSL